MSDSEPNHVSNLALPNSSETYGSKYSPGETMSAAHSGD